MLRKKGITYPYFKGGDLIEEKILACLRGVGCQTSEKGPHVTLLDRVEMVA